MSRISLRTASILAMTALAQVFLVTSWFSLDRPEFITVIRFTGTIGIIFTFFYKEIVWFIQLLTSSKNDFDRFWLWQTQSIALLFLYGFVLNISDDTFAIRHLAIFTWIWFELWFQVMVSAAFVLYYAFTLRVIPAYRRALEEDENFFIAFRYHLAGGDA